MMNITETKEYIMQMLDRLIEHMQKDLPALHDDAPGVVCKQGVCLYYFEGESVGADVLEYNLPLKIFLSLKWLKGKPGGLLLSNAMNTENGAIVECVIKKVENFADAPLLLEQQEYRERAVERFHKCATELTSSDLR